MISAPSYAVLPILLVALACSQPESGEHGREGRGEHAGERRGEHDRGSGEESGAELALDARYDKVRNGARLVLTYDAIDNAFVGAVTNTTAKVLKKVRVEVHLSNGKELGPTAPGDLAPGERRSVRLDATSRDFKRWSAHPEVGESEHGHGGERHGEHKDD